MLGDTAPTLQDLLTPVLFDGHESAEQAVANTPVASDTPTGSDGGRSGPEGRGKVAPPPYGPDRGSTYYVRR
jgi:hypothetical protein